MVADGSRVAAAYGREFTVHEVVKELPRGIVNPFYLDMPASKFDFGLRVFEAINSIFLEAKFAFSGSVREIVDLAAEVGRPERTVRLGFKLLVDRGYVQLEGDKFILRPKWLEHLD